MEIMGKHIVRFSFYDSLAYNFFMIKNALSKLSNVLGCLRLLKHNKKGIYIKVINFKNSS